MEEGFLRIAITMPDAFPEEAVKIQGLLEEEKADFVHLRKPSWDMERLSSLISKIPVRFHKKIKLHDHFDLIEKYDLGGVHLNSRNPIAPVKNISLSKSCHSFKELENIDIFDYVTLSPVFDSISKPGYNAAFDFEILKNILKGKRVVALGGVTPDKFGFLKDLGFYGGAMLSYYWI